MITNHPKRHEEGELLIGTSGYGSSYYEADKDWFVCDFPERRPTRNSVFAHDCKKCLTIAQAIVEGRLKPDYDPPMDDGEMGRFRYWLEDRIKALPS